MGGSLISYLACILLSLAAGIAIAFPLGIQYRKKVAEAELGTAEEEAKRIVGDAIKDAEVKKKEALVEAKDEIHKQRTEAEKEVKERIVNNFGAKCAEMEGAAIAHGAYLNHVPCVIIRAISDKADGSAQVDYPTFEKQAIVHGIKLMKELLPTL